MRIFIGMDLGSKTVKCCAINEVGGIVDRRTMGWEKGEWRGLLGKYAREEVVVAFETGPEGYRARDLLTELGIESYPFHAANFPAIWRSKRKTDKIDAMKMCRALRSGGLPPRVELPKREEAKLRNLISEWEMTLKTIQAQVYRTQGLARQRGVSLPSYRRERGEEWWGETIRAFGAEDRRAVRRIAVLGLGGLQELEDLREEIREQIEKAGLTKLWSLLQSIPGIGPITAAALVAFLGDGRRFRNARKFTAYIGIVPSVDQTGEQGARLGHLTKEGPAVLRRLLVQAALTAIHGRQLQETRWRDWFHKVKKRRGGKVAIVALARKMAEVCYAVARNQEVWDPSRLRRTAA